MSLKNKTILMSMLTLTSVQAECLFQYHHSVSDHIGDQLELIKKKNYKIVVTEGGGIPVHMDKIVINYDFEEGQSQVDFTTGTRDKIQFKTPSTQFAKLVPSCENFQKAVEKGIFKNRPYRCEIDNTTFNCSLEHYKKYFMPTRKTKAITNLVAEALCGKRAKDVVKNYVVTNTTTRYRAGSHMGFPVNGPGTVDVQYELICE